MIPAFNDNGLLPPGIHWAEWDEISERLGFNEYRCDLLFHMQLGIHALQQVGCRAIYIDGSFSTSKEYPGDYDICYDDEYIDWDRFQLIEPTLLEFENARASQKAKFKGEFFPCSAIAELPSRVYLEFFQTDRNTGNKKGIIGLKL